MSRRRSNHEWLDDLRNIRGLDAQTQAFTDLGRYLYTVIFNYLLNRRDNNPFLRALDADYLAELAQDGMHDTLEKMVRDNFDLLNSFKGTGKFTTWMAVIAQRETSRMLKGLQLEEGLDQATHIPARNLTPPTAASQQEVIGALENCLDRLPPNYRFVLVECVMKRRRARDVGEDLDRQENAVYLIIMRAKRKMRVCLEVKGFGPEVLSLFQGYD